MLTGDLLGAGAGLLVAGNLGALAGWRVAFFVLAIPSTALAVCLHRLLPEPARGGQSWLRPGDTLIRPAADQERSSSALPGGTAPSAEENPATSEVRNQVRQRDDVQPDEDRVLRVDPARLRAWSAARYVLRIPSNRVLIVASALGYFFLAGLRTFAVLFARGHFGISQATVSLLLVVIGAGAVIGTVAAGRLADRLIHRGVTNARMVVAGVAFLAAAVVFVPGFFATSIVVSLPVFTVAAALLSAPNPALDAARLDVVVARLWGRAESVRTFVRTLLEASAPLLFGFVSSLLGASSANVGAGVNASHVAVSHAAATGLGYTFLIMLAPLAASGALLIRSRQTYLVDVATAERSERSLRSDPALGQPTD